MITKEQFQQIWDLAIKYHRSKFKQLTLGTIFNLKRVIPNKLIKEIDPTDFKKLESVYQSLFEEFVQNPSVENVRWKSPGKYMSMWADYLEEQTKKVKAMLGIANNVFRN